MELDTLFAGLVAKSGSAQVKTRGERNGAKYSLQARIPAAAYKTPDAKKSAVADFASKLTATTVVRATESVVHIDGKATSTGTDVTGAEFRDVVSSGTTAKA